MDFSLCANALRSKWQCPCHTERSEVSTNSKCDFSALKAWICTFKAWIFNDKIPQIPQKTKLNSPNSAQNDKALVFLKNRTQKIPSKTKNPAHQKNYTLLYMQIFSKTNTAQKIFSPHCNKNYDFSFTFLLNLRNFTHHRAKIRSNFTNFC